MEIIIFIIIIGAAVLKLRLKNAPQKQATVKDINREAAKRNQQTRQNNPGYPKTNSAAKPNNQVKPGYQTQPNRTAKPAANVLDKAKYNVAANSLDELKRKDSQLHKQAGAYIMVDHELDTSQLMKQVSDLMVTGYNGKLEFDRDFIAEGVDMLNKIQG